MANKFFLNEKVVIYGTGESNSFVQGKAYNIGTKVAEAAVNAGYATYEKPIHKPSKDDSTKIAELKKIYKKTVETK